MCWVSHLKTLSVLLPPAHGGKDAHNLVTQGLRGRRIRCCGCVAIARQAQLDAWLLFAVVASLDKISMSNYLSICN